MIFSEISTFPLGFILFNVNKNTPNTFYGCDITLFSNCSDIRNVDIAIPFYSCNTPFGLDFRDL